MLKKTTLFALALASLTVIASGSGALAQSKPTIGPAACGVSSEKTLTVPDYSLTVVFGSMYE